MNKIILIALAYVQFGFVFISTYELLKYIMEYNEIMKINAAYY